jgi:hypothetical protein
MMEFQAMQLAGGDVIFGVMEAYVLLPLKSYHLWMVKEQV